MRDFREMSEAQILDVFNRYGQNTCGMYNADRIKVLPQKSNWQKWTAAAMMVLGLSACHNEVMGKVKLYSTGKAPSKLSAPADTTQLNCVFGGAGLQPTFPGGEVAFAKYMAQHVKNAGNFKGKAFAMFIVEKDGSLTHIEILRSAVPVLDQHIIAALKQMPRWQPGTENGRPVRVQFTMPISFTGDSK
ncbi:energy transducer TonB [Mucilaginibacter gracilis]|uniref:energy transducer TonB n=1 Tax=Mucilaginibacter gracilis TaxID=423350 RepID=UPI0013C35B77|nr:energy transducer TonB [Mucilaginibacter gracilis]